MGNLNENEKEKEKEAMKGELPIPGETANCVKVKTRKTRNLIRIYEVASIKNIPAIKVIWKEKIQLKAHRIRRFEKRIKFFRHKIFKEDPKQVSQ